jgi:hypothetical protein
MMQKLKTAAFNVLIFGGIVFYLIIAFTFLANDEPRVIRYDCTIAEFHPDIPIEVKEACRKIRHVTST